MRRVIKRTDLLEIRPSRDKFPQAKARIAASVSADCLHRDVAGGVDEPLQVLDCELEPPKANEVRVKMKASGVCQSDWHIMNGDWPLPLPMVLVTCPKFAGCVVLMLPVFTPQYDRWFGKLKTSILTSHVKRSRNGKDFLTAAFQLFHAGPTTEYAPRFPNVPERGSANAAGFRYCLPPTPGPE